MYLLNILRFVAGSVYFTAEGGFSERFINFCKENNIHVKDLRFSESSVKGVISAGKYKLLRKIAVQSGMKLKADKKFGLIFLFRQNKNRIGLFFGLFFIIAFLMIVSSFIWTVEVTGNERVSDKEIIRACENIGLKEGSYKKKIDTNEMSRLLMIELSGKVSWISVNVKGTTAIIEARDYLKERADTTYKEPCNIVADFSGLIMKAEVYNGKKIVIEGNGVSEGDLLISGIIENRDTSTEFVEARGKISALHKDRISRDYKKEFNHNNFSRFEVVNKVNIFGIEIPFARFNKTDEAYKEYRNEKFMTFGNIKLPLSICKITRSYYSDNALYSDIPIHNAADEHTNYLYGKYKNTLVLNSTFSVEENDDILNIVTIAECIDFIGEKQIIYIE